MTPNDPRSQAMWQARAAQLMGALDAVVNLQGELAVAKAELAERESQIQTLGARISDLEKASQPKP